MNISHNFEGPLENECKWSLRESPRGREYTACVRGEQQGASRLFEALSLPHVFLDTFLLECVYVRQGFSGALCVTHFNPHAHLTPHMYATNTHNHKQVNRLGSILKAAAKCTGKPISFHLYRSSYPWWKTKFHVGLLKKSFMGYRNWQYYRLYYIELIPSELSVRLSWDMIYRSEVFVKPRSNIFPSRP